MAIKKTTKNLSSNKPIDEITSDVVIDPKEVKDLKCACVISNPLDVKRGCMTFQNCFRVVIDKTNKKLLLSTKKLGVNGKTLEESIDVSFCPLCGNKL